MSDQATPLSQQEVQNLQKQRGSYIRIAAKISQLINPSIFRLELEGLSNIRNSIIIAGALATLGLLIMGNTQISEVAQLFLGLAVVSFLLTILVYSLYLKFNLEAGIKGYKEKRDENVKIAIDGQKIINEILDGKSTKEEGFKRLMEIQKEVEFRAIRPPKESPNSDPGASKLLKNFYILLGRVGNSVFSIGIILLVFSLLLTLWPLMGHSLENFKC